ncbi:hypothetical protein N0V90_007192 [Kalmusia sp. IMI 367209]|nr:hypothetical protein N0V90_007192 [Kalmusia sp. IMI 367209]
MSESLMQTTGRLYHLLETFHTLLITIKAQNEEYASAGSQHDEILHHNIALGAWREPNAILFEATDLAIDHKHLHPEVPIPSLLSDVKDALTAIVEGYATDAQKEIVPAVKASTKEQRNRACEDEQYALLFKRWRKLLMDFRCPEYTPYTLPPNPFGEGTRPPPEEYTYSALPTSTSVRLITMRPEFESDDDTLEIDMHVVDLEDRPVYTALSYTWGKPALVYVSVEERDAAYDERVPILCDGRLFYVGQNLHRYMRQWRRDLRSEEEEKSMHALLQAPKGLWVDALCIHQANDEEKNAQVAMMGRIYQQCDRVLVWLGAWDQFSREASEVILRIHDYNRQDGKREEFNWEGMTIQEKCDAFDLPGEFSWSWVCELALAPTAMFQVGHNCYNWPMLLEAMDFLEAKGLTQLIESLAEQELNGPGCKFAGFSDEDIIAWTRTDRIDEERQIQVAKDFSLAPLYLFVRVLDQARTPTNDSPKLVKLFDIGCRFQCWNPRDRIYAFKAIAQRREYQTGREDWRRKPLDIRYQDSIEDVYLQAAWYIFLSDRNLLLLGSAAEWEQRVEEGLKLPSWVPDWSSPCAIRRGPSLQIDADGTGWRACDGLEWAAPEDAMLYQPCLPISACYVDTVCEVASGTTLADSLEIALNLPVRHR